ncbi:hypothetical protein EniLVp02_0074 [Vibrio phage EniLVp02]
MDATRQLSHIGVKLPAFCQSPCEKKIRLHRITPLAPSSVEPETQTLYSSLEGTIADSHRHDDLLLFQGIYETDPNHLNQIGDSCI